jgi:outer membrane protein OmpA-like peptidoglycan-associated protein
MAVGMLAAVLLAAGPIAHMPPAIAETSPISSGAKSPASSSPPTVLEGLTRRAMSSVLIKEIKRTVRFAPMSAELDAESIQVLAAAAGLVPESATQVKVAAVGYVQPSALHGNDISLSTKRARVVAAALRNKGIGGASTVSGRGRAEQRGAEARRVDVVISFTPTNEPRRSLAPSFHPASG